MRSSAADARSCADWSAVTAAPFTVDVADSPSERTAESCATAIGAAQYEPATSNATSTNAGERDTKHGGIVREYSDAGQVAPAVKVRQRVLSWTPRDARPGSRSWRARAARGRPWDRRRGRARCRSGRPPRAWHRRRSSRRSARTGAWLRRGRNGQRDRIAARRRRRSRPAASSTGTMSCTLGRRPGDGDDHDALA